MTDCRYYALNVAPGVAGIKVSVRPDSGDPDIYAGFHDPRLNSGDKPTGDYPTLTNSTYRSIHFGEDVLTCV